MGNVDGQPSCTTKLRVENSFTRLNFHRWLIFSCGVTVHRVEFYWVAIVSNDDVWTKLQWANPEMRTWPKMFEK